MNKDDKRLDNITIRTDPRPGDLGFVVHRHGKLYKEEYNYGISFEMYVANGLYEFYQRYDADKDRVWIAEHDNEMIGFLLLMHRDNNAAQLRYFYIEPAYRGIGLGKLLMHLFMAFMQQKKYKSAYLWTTNELAAAASLYTRHGFTLTEQKPSTDFGKPLTEMRYEVQVRSNLHQTG